MLPRARSYLYGSRGLLRVYVRMCALRWKPKATAISHFGKWEQAHNDCISHLSLFTTCTLENHEDIGKRGTAQGPIPGETRQEIIE